MAHASSRIYVTSRRVLRTSVGKRLSRFIPVAIVSLATTLVTLDVLVGVFKVTAGTAGVIGAMAGAAVSYVMSRWAWERKGRPNVLKETLPFWAVSVSAWLVLGVTSHYASVWAKSMGLHGLQHIALVDGAYFLVNCVTFTSRFLIFHYVLFTDRTKRQPQPAVEAVPARAATPTPVAGGGRASQVNGSTQATGGIGRPTRGVVPGADTGPLPQAGTRR